MMRRAASGAQRLNAVLQHLEPSLYFASHRAAASSTTTSSGSSSSWPSKVFVSSKRAMSSETTALVDVKMEAANSNFTNVILDREKKYNSLTLPMIRSLKKVFDSCKNSVIWLEGAGPKAFCAGGDVAEISKALAATPRNTQVGEEFFFEEYQLDHQIGTPKDDDMLVTIAVWDKIVMGGGVGLGFHAPIRIVTDKTMFAMPETAIGLFPDVGMTYGLLKLNPSTYVKTRVSNIALARFLGLTGYRLTGSDVFRFGLGTHFVLQEDMPKIKQLLMDKAQGGLFENANKNNLPVDAVRHALRDYSEISDNSDSKFKIEDLDLIERCFGASRSSFEDIMTALEGEKDNELAKKLEKTLHKMSPLALKVTFAAFTKQRDSDSLAQALTLEYRMACHALDKDADFQEGVRALLIDKTNDPKWKYSTVKEVPGDVVEGYFKPVKQELKL